MENQEEVPLSRSPVDFFVKPEQISGPFFDPYAINFPRCLRDRAAGNSCIQIRHKVCFFCHPGFRTRVRKPEKFQKQKDSCRFQGCFSNLFLSVSVSPRMVWPIQIADGIHSFQNSGWAFNSRSSPDKWSQDTFLLYLFSNIFSTGKLIIPAFLLLYTEK